MVKIIIKKSNEVITSIEIKGHAEYDEFGKDIVCASISTMAITSINACLSLDKNSILATDKEGYIRIEKLNDNQEVDKIINNLVNMLKELARDYKKNLNIREEEQ